MLKFTIRAVCLAAVLAFSGAFLCSMPLLSRAAPAVQEKRVNLDQLFYKAQTLARQGKYNEARRLCRAVLQQAPGYQDARVLLGRLYLWAGDIDTARSEFWKVLTARPGFLDARLALIETETRAHNLDEALRLCNEGLVQFSGDEDLLLKKAHIQAEQKDYKGASQTVRRLLRINPSHTDAQLLRKHLQYSELRFSLVQHYRGEVVRRKNGRLQPWHFLALEFSVRPRLGTLIGRFNYAHRSNGDSSQSGVQFEIDAWPVIQKGVYAYLNAGYSASVIFPRLRLGGELYIKLPQAFEISAGARTMKFSGGHVYIYTGSLGKYYRNYWFSFRPFISSASQGVSAAVILRVRCYHSSSDNYLGLLLGYGSVPVYLYFLEDLVRYDSFRVGLELKRLVHQTFAVLCHLRYEREEYLPGAFGNRYILEIRLEERFFKKY